MTTNQVAAIRKQVNAAYAAGDTKKADALMKKLHDNAVAEADRFMKSDAGKVWMSNLMERP